MQFGSINLHAMENIVKQLLVATGNRHKAEEISAMLGPDWEVKNLKDYPDLVSPEETGLTFEENAKIKALSASLELPTVLVLSDDSGLEVDALDLAPGVISARYAGEGASDADNRTRLKEELSKVQASGVEPPFTGRFRCCMVLAIGGEVLAVTDGAVEGTLLTEEDGEGGFGYDALFVPEGHDHSFGVLPAELKNGLSHRARALGEMVKFLATRS